MCQVLSLDYPSMCVTEMCPHNGEIAFEAPCNELCSHIRYEANFSHRKRF